ncbi:MAG: phosphoserine phosphatase SerB [Burkholderiaceae bacterium]|jgi:phosphoserine phosphatase|nr:phosphoserine phosphatase SerB [Burkholderiaceae bacterium]
MIADSNAFSAPLAGHPRAPSLTARGIALPLALRDYRLIAFDMDSTLITIECVDEIAAAVGRKAEVAAITEAAMRGEITDFKDSLRRRVALLAGVTEPQLQQVYRERLRLSPGAAELLLACKAAGLKTLLVSGGFSYFAERLRDRLALDFVRSNRLEIVDGRLTGRILPQSWGDICDGAAKRATLLTACSLIGCEPRQAIAVGDGANDLPMMAAAGLSVAYHAKPKVREQAQVTIDTGGLERLLELFGP